MRDRAKHARRVTREGRVTREKTEELPFCACFKNNHVLYGNFSFGDYLSGI